MYTYKIMTIDHDNHGKRVTKELLRFESKKLDFGLFRPHTKKIMAAMKNKKDRFAFADSVRCVVMNGKEEAGEARIDVNGHLLGDDGGGMDMMEWENESPKAIKELQKNFSPEYQAVVAKARKQQKTKNAVMTMRLDNELKDQIDHLAALVSKKTGIDVTQTWVVREALNIALPLIEKKYRG